MNAVPMPLDELHQLASGVLDGSITADQFSRLCQLLSTDLRSQRFFVRYVDLHASLASGLARLTPARSEHFSDTSSVTLGSQIAELPALAEYDRFDELRRDATLTASNDLLSGSSLENAGQSRRLVSPVLGFLHGFGRQAMAVRALLILLVFGFLVTAVWNWRGQPRSLDSTTGATVAYLTAEKDCQWIQTDPAVGGRLASGLLRLRSGVAELELVSGTRLFVEGPSDFELQSSSRMLLARGKLLAHVPQQAIGFTVETPNAKVVDRGTEFVIEAAEDSQTKVAVTKGTVDLSSGTGDPQRLTAGKAMTVSHRVGSDTLIEPAPFDAAWIDRAARLVESLPRTSVAAVAFQVSPDGAAGNQGNYHDTLGLDFDVNRPIRVTSLGVFDHLGDGIDVESTLTAQLWSRDTLGSANPADDTGNKMLAELSFPSHDPGILLAGHRFKPLAKPIDLTPGSYTVITRGFSKNNCNINFILATEASQRVETSNDAITPVLASRCQKPGAHDVFPKSPTPMPLGYAAGSFRYVPLDSRSRD